MTKFLESNTSTVLLLIVLLIVSILVLNYALQPTMDETEWREEAYRVQAGDTLWTIAGGYCPQGVDRREWVEEIRALNGLRNNTIHPGQTITVLTPVKEDR